MNRIIIVVLCLFSVVNCFAENDLDKIEIGKALDNRVNLSLSNYAVSIDYIPLDSKKCFLPSEKYLFIQKYGNEFFLILRTQSNLSDKALYKFTADGDFVMSAIDNGRALGEYTNISSIAFAGGSGDIALLDLGKLYIYDKNGTYKKEIELKSLFKQCSSICRVEYVNDTTLLVVWTDYNMNQYLATVGYNGSVEHKKKLGNVLVKSVKMMGGIGRDIAQYDIIKCGNMLRLISASTDTVSTFNTISTRPSFFLDFGRYRKETPIDDFCDNGVRIITNGIRKPIENSQMILFSVLLGPGRYPNLNFDERFVRLLYDKKAEKTYALKFNKFYNQYSFVNDIDGGMPFWPSYVTDDAMYCLVDATDFIDMAQKSNSAKMKEVAARLTEDSNPVLVVVTLKAD